MPLRSNRLRDVLDYLKDYTYHILVKDSIPNVSEAYISLGYPDKHSRINFYKVLDSSKDVVTTDFISKEVHTYDRAKYLK